MRFDESFIKICNQEVMKSMKVVKIAWLSQWLSFLTDRIRIQKFEELITYLHDKTEYVILIRNLK